MGCRSNKFSKIRGPLNVRYRGWYDKCLIVVDLDGTICEGRHIPEEQRTPEAYQDLRITSFGKHILYGTRFYPTLFGTRLVILTKRDPKTLKDVTAKWLTSHGFEGEVLFAENHLAKIKILDEVIPKLYNVDRRDILAFDDRWKELLTSRVIYRTHYGYQGQRYARRRTKIFTQGTYRDYPELAIKILNRFIRL